MSRAHAFWRRLGLRYSLKAMLIGIGLLAIVAGWIADRAHRQYRAVEILYALAQEKRASYFYRRGDGTPSYSPSPRLEWDFGDTLAEVWLREVGDDDVAEIAGPLHAELLAVRYCPTLTDAGLRHLTEAFPWVRQIEITGCPRITDSGFCALLKSFPNLNYIYLSECPQITHVALRELAHMARLRDLHVHIARPPDAWLGALRGAKELRSLNFTTPTFVDIDFDELAKLEWLDTLYVHVLAETNHQQWAEFYEYVEQALPRCEYDLFPSSIGDPGDLFRE